MGKDQIERSGEKMYEFKVSVPQSQLENFDELTGRVEGLRIVHRPSLPSDLVALEPMQQEHAALIAQLPDVESDPRIADGYRMLFEDFKLSSFDLHYHYPFKPQPERERRPGEPIQDSNLPKFRLIIRERLQRPAVNPPSYSGKGNVNNAKWDKSISIRQAKAIIGRYGLLTGEILDAKGIADFMRTTDQSARYNLTAGMANLSKRLGRELGHDWLERFARGPLSDSGEQGSVPPNFGTTE